MSLILEQGKKYVVRNPEAKAIEWVRVDAIRPEADLHVNRVAVTIKYYDGRVTVSERGINGEFFEDGAISNLDLVAEYVEPGLELGPEHVGCRVRMRNGRVCIVDTYYPDSAQFRVGSAITYANGRYNTEGESPLDIVELLDEPRPFTRGGK